MTDDNRTTLNVDRDEHRATREVKREYGESWTDVLRFYREHRAEVSVGDPDLAAEIQALRERVERVPESTADELEARRR